MKGVGFSLNIEPISGTCSKRVFKVKRVPRWRVRKGLRGSGKFGVFRAEERERFWWR